MRYGTFHHSSVMFLLLLCGHFLTMYLFCAFILCSAVEAFIRSKYERKQYYKKQDKPAATPTNSGSKADKVESDFISKLSCLTPHIELCNVRVS